MVATAVVVMEVTARGLLMLSPRLLLRLDTAMAVTAVDMVATAVVVMEVTAAATATARGRLSPATAMAVMAAATAAMAATAGAAAMATGVSYHRIRRSELSQKQNHKN